MRWPNWTDCFGRCCGLRQGPHHQHYDAWLARERLNQLKRLEIKLADLTRENGELSARLGQAVGILDSYHSFDMDQLGIAPAPQVPDALRQDSASRRRLAAAAGSVGGSEPSSTARGESLGGRGGRSSSIASVPPQVSHRLALSRHSVGGNSLISGAAPGPPMARKGSLQFQPSARTCQAPPPRVRQQMSRQVPPPAAPPPAAALNIPSREELDDLLRRSERRRQGAADRGRRPSLDTVVDVPPFVPPASREGSDDVASVASEPPPGGPVPPLPTIGEGSGELSVDYEASRALSDGDGRPEDRAAGRRRGPSPRASLEGRPAMGGRTDSFSFAPPAGRDATADSPHQMAMPSPFANGARAAPPSLPSVMAGDNTQPVRDDLRLATEARGQVYTAHYSPESSPFARAAARMPAADGKMPLSRHLPAR